jgi:hypothetical protein
MGFRFRRSIRIGPGLLVNLVGRFPERLGRAGHSLKK